MLQKVYQLCSQIPKGKVSTYKIIALEVYGKSSAARAVGTILRKCECKGNSYDSSMLKNIQQYQCPYKCYRIVRSNFEVGEFICRNDNSDDGKSRVEIKREKLAREGVFFDKKGYLLKNSREKVIFKDFL
ncbi:MAG: hypothetical protein MRERC_1c026 [Mycoplasmataceae bacterium RC_NB112A]|nr:MAG: hypothetical protein MRERC_10c010 [Mycoplasmataceae bacterium RC_NB112A]KLL02445.1 MAG: hypothetical protein MRERC_1c026 [Mycoplasmataceae bacterium RC_NB112A]